MSKFGWSYPPGCSGPPDDDALTGCLHCGLEPLADDDGECDYFHWFNREFCSESCRKGHEASHRAERDYEASLAADWAADEMTAQEYWEGQAREALPEIECDDI